MKILQKILTRQTTHYLIVVEIQKQKRKIQIEAILTEMYNTNSGTQEYYFNICSDPFGYALSDKQKKELKSLAINFGVKKQYNNL